MILSDDIIESAISLKDMFFDLSGLSKYCSLKVPTLRDHIRSGGLPAFKVKGKILVRKSEFDQWLEQYRINKNQKIDNIVDDILSSMKG